MDKDRKHQSFRAGIHGQRTAAHDGGRRQCAFYRFLCRAAAYSSSLVYGVTKAAIHFLTKSLVKEFEPKGITVNAIAPGFIETPWHSARTQESYDRINRKIALHRFGTVEEVADMAYAVLSNGYMNGSVVDIHGGYDYF